MDEPEPQPEPLPSRLLVLAGVALVLGLVATLGCAMLVALVGR